MWQKLTTLVALPAKCGFCGGVHKEYFVDTGLQFEFYGALVICNECVNDLVNFLGYASQETVAKYREKLADDELIIQTQQTQIQSLQEAIINLNKALLDDNPLRDVLRDFNSRSADDSVVGSDASSTSPEREGREEGASESTNDEDLAGLRAASSELDFTFDDV